MLDRKLRQKVENAFYHYESNKKEGVSKIIEIAESGLTAKYDSVGNSHNEGNPTESKCLKNIDDNNALQWCYVVERTLTHFTGTGKDALIKLRYFQRQSINKICKKLYIDKRTLFRWTDEILIYSTMIALQLNLLKINF